MHVGRRLVLLVAFYTAPPPSINMIDKPRVREVNVCVHSVEPADRPVVSSHCELTMCPCVNIADPIACLENQVAIILLYGARSAMWIWSTRDGTILPLDANLQSSY